MAVSNIKASFACDIKKVWELAANAADYTSWRSDLGRVEILNEKQFKEYTKDGYATTFTITLSEPHSRLEFDMDNPNMYGHWTGVFEEKDGLTKINFTEDIIPRKPFLRPFVKFYLKKQQARFVLDMKKALKLQPDRNEEHQIKYKYLTICLLACFAAGTAAGILIWVFSGTLLGIGICAAMGLLLGTVTGSVIEYMKENR